MHFRLLVLSPAYLADGAAMASAGRDGTARLWHLSRDVTGTLEPAALLLNTNTMKGPEGDRPFVKVAVSPNQQRIAAITVKTLTLLDLSTGDVLARTTVARSFGSDSSGIASVAFAPDGRRIVVGGTGPVAFLAGVGCFGLPNSPTRSSADRHVQARLGSRQTVRGLEHDRRLPLRFDGEILDRRVFVIAPH